MADGNRGGSADKAPPPRPIPAIEWVVAGLGAVLVAGSIAFMVFEAVTKESRPPAVVAYPDAPRAVPGGYLVPILAMNQGGATAANTRVTGTLRDATGTVETSEIAFDYIPAESERRGGLFFQADPSRYRLEVRANGYVEP